MVFQNKTAYTMLGNDPHAEITCQMNASSSLQVGLPPATKDESIDFVSGRATTCLVVFFSPPKLMLQCFLLFPVHTTLNIIQLVL
jgi:hypothetical protein